MTDAQRERLQAIIDDQYVYTDDRKAVAAALARIAELEGVLRSVEWIESRHGGDLVYCPSCQRLRDREVSAGHIPDCALAAALKAPA